MRVQYLFATLLFIGFLSFSSFAQRPEFPVVTDQNVDDFKIRLSEAKNDTTKIIILSALGIYYIDYQSDSAIFYIEKIIPLIKQYNYQFLRSTWLSALAYSYGNKQDYTRALELLIEAKQLAEDPKSIKGVSQAYKNHLGFQDDYKVGLHAQAFNNREFGLLYLRVGNKELSLKHLLLAQKLYKSTGRRQDLAEIAMNISEAYISFHLLDSALYFGKEALDQFQFVNDQKYLGVAYGRLGTIHQSKKEFIQAKDYYTKAIESSKDHNTNRQLVYLKRKLGEVLVELGDYTAAMKEAKEAIAIANETGYTQYLPESNLLLSSCYEIGKEIDKAYYYSQLGHILKDSLQQVKAKNINKFHSALLAENLRNRDLKEAQIAIDNKRRTYILLISLGLFLIISFLLYRNIRQKVKSNQILKNQKEKLQQTLGDLKSTQSQLIQSEKMASLGELTAGIAHEIQNPLNFVNNFSEVSGELLDEMNEEIEAGDIDEVKIIVGDIKQNLEKINHHGKRASDIVKGMLQHSRTSTGQKEPTDINALADEYLRLAYHGLRAKDKSFNADFKTEFDETIPKVNVIPQDIGRVLLNLINNAFFAVNQKAARHSDPEHSEGVESGVAASHDGYQPEVVVSTEKLDGHIEISVKDNGEGIREQVRDKIFQPFFTTKPTGSGTGLGLSLSYDIVKAHGGELKVESEAGEGSEFVIILPVV